MPDLQLAERVADNVVRTCLRRRIPIDTEDARQIAWSTLLEAKASARVDRARKTLEQYLFVAAITQVKAQASKALAVVSIPETPPWFANRRTHDGQAHPELRASLTARVPCDILPLADHRTPEDALQARRAAADRADMIRKIRALLSEVIEPYPVRIRRAIRQHYGIGGAPVSVLHAARRNRVRMCDLLRAIREVRATFRESDEARALAWHMGEILAVTPEWA
jgi:hypothetical protein